MYPTTRDQLAIVEFDPLQILTTVEMQERHVADEGAVVELDHGQRLGRTQAATQLADAFIRDVLAVRQGLEYERAIIKD